MTENKLSFQYQNLVVDWIGFNIEGFNDIEQIKQIAEYLFQNFGFNSTLNFKSQKQQEILFFKSKNKNQVYFTEYKYSDMYWNGIKIDFSGNKAAQIYKHIQEQKLDWNIFKSANLSRFDLYYFRKAQNTDQKEQLEKFFSDSISKLAKINKKNNCRLDLSTKGYILRIGNRKSSNFYRIYQTENGFKFELEIKKNQIKKLSNLLFCYDIEEFEEILTKHFHTYSKKLLTLNNCHTDWLVKYSRKTTKPINSLVTTYFIKKINKLSEGLQVFFLLQFLSFSRSKNYTKIKIYDQNYCLIQFTLKEYIEFLGVQNINQYQRNKFINLFYSFQKTEPFITYFSESHFQSLLSFPYLDIQKEGNSWVVKVAVLELLYYYYYPFSFPNTFLTYKNIYDLQIKIKFIESISVVSLEKVFYVEIFLEQFNISTSKKAVIKKDIVKIFSQLQMDGIIKNHYKVVKKSKQIEEVSALTHLLIGQTNRIYFYENL